jgi:2-keto-4-pentenoate hydratase/2-oxohepta-3-ene-1,7-dioic acid hydratase in catechol pathway
MRLLRYGPKGQERPGVLDQDGHIRSLAGTVTDVDGALLASALDRLKQLDVATLPRVEDSVRIAEPVARVGKFICIGLNYRDHAREAGMPIPTEPIIFMKAISAIIGPNDDVLLPPNSRTSDWDVELGVVIGKEAR